MIRFHPYFNRLDQRRSESSVFETKYLVSKNRTSAVLSALNMRCSVPEKFSVASVKTMYFDDAQNTSFLESLDGHEYKRKFRLREYIGSIEGATYSLEIKIRSGSVTSKIRELIYKKLPAGYVPCSFRDLLSTFESIIGKSLSNFRLEAAGAELYPSTEICYQRQRFDDPRAQARYNLDTSVMVTMSPFSGYASYSLDHDIFEIKSAEPEHLPQFLRGMGLEPFSFSKFVWGKERSS